MHKQTPNTKSQTYHFYIFENIQFWALHLKVILYVQKCPPTYNQVKTSEYDFRQKIRQIVNVVKV